MRRRHRHQHASRIRASGGSGERRRSDLNDLIEEARTPLSTVRLWPGLNAPTSPSSAISTAISPRPTSSRKTSTPGFFKPVRERVLRGQQAPPRRRRSTATLRLSRLWSRTAARRSRSVRGQRHRHAGPRCVTMCSHRFLRRSRLARAPGLGMGCRSVTTLLSLNRSIGGTIAVDSRENEFTEFTIRLPRALPGAAAAPAAAAVGAAI